MKKTGLLLFLIVLLYSSFALSGGRTSWAVPAKIDTTGIHNGIMIWGAFGNPANCTQANSVWVKGEHIQYDKIYSTVLAALMAGKQIMGYIHSCESVGWYSGSAITYNVLGPAGDLQIKN